jgi:hypothetical protein
MKNATDDFAGVNEISNPMSKGEYGSFLAKADRKKYFNDAVRGKDGFVISANAQILTGADILEENKVGI